MSSPDLHKLQAVPVTEDTFTTGIELPDLAKVPTIRHPSRNPKDLDPNLPVEETTLDEGNLERAKAEEQGPGIVSEVENSPYPEVRATVRPYDEYHPASTIRAWTIGLLLTTLGAGINCLFSLRNPSIAITTFVVQLIAYPLGRGWDLFFPDREFSLFNGRIKFNLCPGKFNYEEHAVIVVMANAAYSGGAIYATDVLISQQVFYKQTFGWAFQLLFAITNQMLGYGLAGVSRRWLVWPSAMIWPSNLVNCALIYAFHDRKPTDPAKTDGWAIGRYRWVMFITAGGFCWYFVPGFLFQGLSYFTFICWIAPKNVIINQLFGGSTGPGLLPVTLDWTPVFAFLGSPLIPPWFVICNTMIGLFVFVIATVLGIHYTGSWYAEYFPMQDSRSYDNTGRRYNVSRILDSNYIFSDKLYNEYSPIFLSTNFALCYGISFASIASVITHTYLYERKTIWRQFKAARNQEDDIHMRLMKKYEDAPDWWYLAMFVVMLALSFLVILNWDTHFEWWAMIVCILIPIVWVVPVGIVFATTNISIGLNVITEFIIGLHDTWKTPGNDDV